MSLANKSFKNNRTGDVVKVIDSFENIAILENKQKIDTRTLMDPNQYTEQIDPGSFFNNQGAYNILAEKIKNIPTTNLVDDEGASPVIVNPYTNEFSPTTSESAVVYSSEDDEKAELVRKYGATLDNASALNKQNQAFARLLGEETDEPVEIQQEVVKPLRPVAVVQEVQQPPIQRIEVEDPIIKMFKGVKRIVDFNISLQIDNKIPRLDFIEMMEDSYETSIIDFLADEFTKEIVNNPEKIKSMISEKIKTMLSNKSVNSQITDSVTQTNSTIEEKPIELEKEPVLSKDLTKKTTRKSRTKKEN